MATRLFYFETKKETPHHMMVGGLGLSAEISFGSSFCPALFAVNRSVCGWFKREFSNFCPAV